MFFTNKLFVAHTVNVCVWKEWKNNHEWFLVMACAGGYAKFD